MYTCVETLDQPAVIDSSRGELLHGGFCSRYNNNQYAVGIYMGIAL